MYKTESMPQGGANTHHMLVMESLTHARDTFIHTESRMYGDIISNERLDNENMW